MPDFDFAATLQTLGFGIRRGVRPRHAQGRYRCAPLYRTISELHIPGDTILVASSLAFAARIAHDKLGVPLATVHLSPAVFRSLFDGPRFPAGALGPGVPSRSSDCNTGWPTAGGTGIWPRPINDLRRELGLPHPRRDRPVVELAAPHSGFFSRLVSPATARLAAAVTADRFPAVSTNEVSPSRARRFAGFSKPAIGRSFLHLDRPTCTARNSLPRPSMPA